jgi:hypothetical protein
LAGVSHQGVFQKITSDVLKYTLVDLSPTVVLTERNFLKILINKDIQTLNELGIKIYQEYPNIRFLFEIDFSKDDYLYIKQLFQNALQLKDTYFIDDFFLRYFRNNKNHRIPFLILLVGFIRYEYLNDENQANFFNNFLRNILQNKKADANDFRKAIVDYFFRWRGNKIHKEEGLYIYETQTSGVSLKLEDAGRHKYLNSFIFHSGGVSEQDLKEYLKIIKYLSENHFDYNTNPKELYQLYKNKDFNIYSNKLSNLLDLLDSESEISEYIKEFIIQSVIMISNNKQQITFTFKLPLYIKNYLLFIGKYGDDLENINISETDFFYENRTIVFSPTFYEIYKKIGLISFKIDKAIFEIDKNYDIYTQDDFEKFRVKIDNISSVFTIELFIDYSLFKRFEINLFKNEFILLNGDFNIKKVTNKEIYIPKNDEDKNYYIISKQPLKNFDLADISLEGYLIYLLPLDINKPVVNINDQNYNLYFSPKLLSNIQYKDSENFIYLSELPKYQLSPKDKEKFIVKDLFTDDNLDYESFYKYNEPIGKFNISINNKSFNVIYIDGFEILQWFNWYGSDKIIKIKLSNKDIKVNSNEIEKDNNGVIHIFKLKNQENILVFNQLNGKNIHLKILKPEIQLSFLDKRKNETKIKSKNIRFERLNFYRQLKIKLINYPIFIKFENLKIGIDEVEVTKNFNNYFVSIKKIKDLLETIDKDYIAITLKNKHYFLPITNIIFDDSTIKKESEKKEIKIYDIDFLIHNTENVKYYFKNKPYFINGIETEEISGFKTQMLVLNEVRQTKKETVVKKSFDSIKKDGLYVKLEDIDYE